MQNQDDNDCNKENNERDEGSVGHTTEPSPVEPTETSSGTTSQTAEHEHDRAVSQTGQQRISITEQAFVDRIRKSDRWMIGLTGAIAAGGLISAVIFGYQLREMQTASYLTRESIRISGETLVATQRPWVSIEMTILGPLAFDANGAEIDIGVELKNHGHSPAMHVRHFVTLDPDAAGHKGPDFCDLQRTKNLENFAQVLFPEDRILHMLTARADSGEIKKATRRDGIIAPLITACVDYLSELDNIRHQTELTANLVKITTPDRTFAIKLSEGNVPKSDLHLEQVFGAHRAD